MNKKVTIEISDEELDGMEDYFTVDFERNYEEEERCRKIVQKIWQRLVEVWDKK